MGSTTVHLRPTDPAPPSLALVAGLAVYEAVRGFAGPAAMMLKWPNDLLVGDAKLAGILLERSGNVVVVGIGANLIAAPHLPDRKATCLAHHSASPPGRDAFAVRLADCFVAALDIWRVSGLDAVRQAWQQRAHPVGTVLRAGDPQIAGRFAGLADDGSLLLDTPSGRRTITGGEVSLVTQHEEEGSR